MAFDLLASLVLVDVFVVVFEGHDDGAGGTFTEMSLTQPLLLMATPSSPPFLPASPDPNSPLLIAATTVGEDKAGSPEEECKITTGTESQAILWFLPRLPQKGKHQAGT